MKKGMKIWALTVSCVALLGGTAGAQTDTGMTAGQMTLNQAISVGVMTNPEYGVVAASRRATDEELEQAKGLWYPSIDFRGDTGLEYTDDVGTRNDGDSDDEETLWRYEAGITLTQMLFDGWETKYENERQKHRVESSAHRVRETAELVGLSIVENFLEVMRQRELLAITQQNVAEHLAIMGMIEEGVSAGRSTQATLLGRKNDTYESLYLSPALAAAISGCGRQTQLDRQQEFPW